MKLAPPTLESTVNVLSTMITPAVLIMACGSLILTTSTRLIRAVDRIRELDPELESLSAAGDERAERKRDMLLNQLDRATSRARMLQRALMQLYSALGFFVGTSVGLALSALSNLAAWVPLILGLIGAALLLTASVVLILESRIALAATYAETDYIRSISRDHAPKLLDRDPSRMIR
ncbi:MAG TPA: DUF2721 domain-containing protein [Thermoanaerobaculia bacterium]